MVELTIEITQFCDENCPWCSSNASRFGAHLPLDFIMKFLDEAELKSHNDPVTRINISGGEPLAHPDIYKILKKCYSITSNVYIYTNMIRHIIYNANVFYKRYGGYCPKITVDANVLIVPGREAPIPDNVDHIHLLKLTTSGRGKASPIPITASHNFFDPCEHNCSTCNNKVLQADGKVVDAPCKKEYDEK